MNVTSDIPPSLEVLIPFYGDASLLHEAVRSVIRQTDLEWRLIVLDDASPGPPVKPWLDRLGDTRISYYRNERNLGVTASFDRLSRLASADLIVFMGYDDTMCPSYVANARRRFATAERQDAAYQPAVRVIDSSGREVLPLGDRVKRAIRRRASSSGSVRGEDLAASLLLGCWTYFPSICWRRELVVRYGFDPRFHIVQDLRLLLALAADGYSVLLDEAPTFNYRRHLGAVSSVALLTGDRLDEEKSLFRLAAEQFDILGWEKAARAARRHYTSRLNALALLPRAWRSGTPGTMRRLLAHALV